MLRKDEFGKFVKTVFKMTNCDYSPSGKQINVLFQMIHLEYGRASRESMFIFLKNLSRARPPKLRKVPDDMDSLTEI